MPQSAWSDKRERQYDHIKEGLEDRGRPEKLAKRSPLAPSTRSAPGPENPPNPPLLRSTTSPRDDEAGSGHTPEAEAEPGINCTRRPSDAI